MKSTFSNKWKASTQPRKQRKYRYNAPLHSRRSMLSVHLSKELRTKYKKRNFPLVKGDTVKVMRGQFKGKSGKISDVDYHKLRVFIEGIESVKKDGNKVPYPINPSNLMITTFKMEDKKRLTSLERK